MSPAFEGLERSWPAVSKLLPVIPGRSLTLDGAFKNIPFLLQGGILCRLLYGLTRIVADAPPLNPNPVSDRQKLKSLGERVFIECAGTLGGFVILQATQDVASKVIQAINPLVHPKALLNNIKALSLTERETSTIGKALTQSFGVSQLKQVKNALSHQLYQKVTIAKIEDTLANPALFKTIEPAVTAFFKRNNTLNAVVIGAGLTANFLFAGVLWQEINDGWFRKKCLPRILDLALGPVNNKNENHKNKPDHPTSLSTATFTNAVMPTVVGLNTSFSSPVQPLVTPSESVAFTPTTKPVATFRPLPVLYGASPFMQTPAVRGGLSV